MYCSCNVDVNICSACPFEKKPFYAIQSKGIIFFFFNFMSFYFLSDGDYDDDYGSGDYADYYESQGKFKHFTVHFVYFLVPSEGRHNVYFLMACAFLMQSLGMSTLCRDSDCLLYAGTWTVYFVRSP